SAAIQDSAASSRSFLPMACTPASSWATVPDPSGRVRAFSLSSRHRSSKVFTGVKGTAWARSDCTGPSASCLTIGSPLARPGSVAQRAQQERGRQGGVRRLGALVLARALDAGAVERLGLGVAGEQPEADRHAVVERDPVEAVGGGGADEV